MPPIKQKVKDAAKPTPTAVAVKIGDLPKPTQPTTVDFMEYGFSWVLANLAESCGMDVASCCESPAKLAQAGLPVPLPKGVSRLAHKMHRDMVDAMLWRSNGSRQPLEPSSPQAAQESRPEAKALVGSIQPKEKTAKPATQSDDETPAKPRTAVLGAPATAVIRALGLAGWEFDDIKKALIGEGACIADSTIKIQMKAGATGDMSRGLPAELTKADLAKLKSHCK